MASLTRRSARCGAALAVAAAAMLAATPGAAADEPDAPGVLIAFLPASHNDELLQDLARRNLAVGLVSPTLAGAYSRRQTALDVSQGARVAGRAYDEPLGDLRLAGQGRGGVIEGFGAAARRAEGALGDVVPGLAAETITRSGGSTAFVDSGQEVAVEAAAVADRAGRIEELSRGPASTLPARALAAWRRHDLSATMLPAEPFGLAALDSLLAARAPEDLLIVLRRPPPGDLQLLAAGVAGLGTGGRLRSVTTRRSGLVTATDLAPTALDHLGLDRPTDMQGRPIERGHGGGAGQVAALGARLSVIIDRRMAAVRWTLLAWIALIGLLSAVGGRRGLRAGLRVGLLGGLWLPSLALLTAALSPSRGAEVAVLALGAVVLGGATDRLVPWPAAPAAPAAVLVLAHAVDLAAGSPLTALSLAGPSPRGGSRFYGVGNELETILSVGVLLGMGAALSLRSSLAPSRGALAFAAACGLTALVLGAGRLGADVGAVITLGAGGAAAALVMLAGRERGLGRRAYALAIGAPLAAIVVLVALDLATGGGAHFTRSVLEADDSGDLLDVAARRFDASYTPLKRPGVASGVAAAVMLVVLGLWQRRRLLAPLTGRGMPLRAAMAGALAATVVGALANDSGPTILMLGTALLALAAAYVVAAPPEALHGSPAAVHQRATGGPRPVI